MGLGSETGGEVGVVWLNILIEKDNIYVFVSFDILVNRKDVNNFNDRKI
jgi:hypothetical protein